MDNSLIDMTFAQRLGMAAAVVAAQALLIWVVWFLFKKATTKIRGGDGGRIKPLKIRNLMILTVKQIQEVIVFFFFFAKYLITLI
jgi:hypothetical protein